MIKAIFFDFDGTLADTAPAIVRTAQESFRVMGLPIPSDEAVRQTIGLPLTQALQVQGNLSLEDAQRAADIYGDNFLTFEGPLVRVFPHVQTTLEVLQQRGIRMAICTSRNVESLDYILEHRGLKPYFETKVTNDDHLTPKPAPDMVQALLERLHVKPEEVLVVGDTTFDIEMGNGAGCRTVAVTYGNHSREQLQTAHPTFVIDDFAELENVLAEVENKGEDDFAELENVLAEVENKGEKASQEREENVVLPADGDSSSIQEKEASAASNAEVTTFEGGTMTLRNGLNIVSLRGNWKQMGRQYGKLAKHLLEHVYAFLMEKADTEEKRTKVTEIAELLFSRYPQELRAFVRGAAETSGMTESMLRMVNAVEYAEPAFMCSALAVWGEWAKDGLVFGRNYDAMSYLPIKGDMLVTVFHPEDGLSAATVGYAGELYAVNGLNEKGLFLELNNGMPSAGFEIDYTRNASTTELLMLLFRAETMADVDRFFRETSSFSSLLIGVADQEEARSYEWCAAGMHRADGETPEGTMMQTNHYVHPAWPYPLPDDEKAWFTRTRRNNIGALAEQYKGQIDAEQMKRIMSTPLQEGGPRFDPFTLYQMVYEPAKGWLHVKITEQADWQALDMRALLKR